MAVEEPDAADPFRERESRLLVEDDQRLAALGEAEAVQRTDAVLRVAPHRGRAARAEPIDGRGEHLQQHQDQERRQTPQDAECLEAQQDLDPDECPEDEEIIEDDVEHIDEDRGDHEDLRVADAEKETPVGNDEEKERQAEELVLHVVGAGARESR